MQDPPSPTPLPDEAEQILWMLVIFTFGSALPISTINVALPEIASELGMSAKSISWVPLIFLLASVIFVLPCGRMADLHGRMKLFRGSIYLVIISGILSALAASAEILLVLAIYPGCGRSGRLRAGNYTRLFGDR